MYLTLLSSFFIDVSYHQWISYIYTLRWRSQCETES